MKRRSRRNAIHTYNDIGRSLADKAADVRARKRYEPALRALLLEVKQFHACAYPKCTGGCPAHEAIHLAHDALKEGGS